MYLCSDDALACWAWSGCSDTLLGSWGEVYSLVVSGSAGGCVSFEHAAMVSAAMTVGINTMDWRIFLGMGSS